ncbi:MAG TPA: hypothetical protein VN823_02250 [Stellaceae bacterium]|nr:hypothetical protein [Stellaceae bacterium]
MPTNRTTRHSPASRTTNTDVEFGEKQYLSATHLAARLRVSVRTLARWDARRVGPPKIKIGKCVLYDLAKLPAWLESHEIEAVRGGHRDHAKARRTA